MKRQPSRRNKQAPTWRQYSLEREIQVLPSVPYKVVCRSTGHMDSVSPQDVYARHLVSRRGYPLWTPEPSLSLPDVYRQQGLKIGDVGVVVPEDGSFDVFFNICLPSTHSLHRPTGVPNDFNPIQLEDRDIAIFPEAESAGRIISTSSVARIGRQSSNEDTTRASQPGPLNYEFTLSSKEGALLILPEGAERYYLRNQRPFLEEAIQHAVDWYNFAEQRLGRIISHDSLYLITGFYKARSWSLASYEQASGVGGVYAQFKAVQVGGGNVSASYTWETTHALDWRVGPSNQYYNGIANQSVFIQGFKIAVRSSILGTKRVKVTTQPPVVRPQQAVYTGSRRSKVGTGLLSNWFSASASNAPRETDAVGVPEGSSDSSSIPDDADDDIIIQHVPQVSKPFHPSDIINQFLLRSNPTAVIAITHDTQWSTLLESEALGREEIVQDGWLETLVCTDMSPVSREGVIYLENITLPSDNDTESSASEQVEDLEKPSGDVGQESPQPDTVATRPRDALNAPVVEAQSHTLYESESSSRPGITRTFGMFKRRHSPTSPNFVPDTPKFQKLSLQEEPWEGSSRPATRTEMRRPQTPAMVTLSPKDPLALKQPAKPLRSILKRGGKNAQPRDLYENEMFSANKAVRFSEQKVLPSGSRLVPMKQPAFDLHWQLCPYDPRRSRHQLRFDIAFPVDEIVFEDSGFRTKLSDADLDKSAANGTMTKMHITCEHTPFFWEVDVKRVHGIRCRDVFEAIYKAFNEQLMLEEKRLVYDRRAVEEAFRLRCKLVPGLSEVERSFGWKRVDVLLHQTIFLGLTQPKSGGDWVLNLGLLPHTPRPGLS